MEFRPDFNAVESGMDAFINWNKDFVGKSATQSVKDSGVERKLVTLVVDTNIDVTLDEAVLCDDKAVGYITSGGFAHRSKKSMAMAYVDVAKAEAGTTLQVEILGDRFDAIVLGEPIYDPSGAKMRG